MKILFLSVSDREELFGITFPKIKEYANKYNYEFHYATDTLDDSRHISWSKIVFILQQMLSYPYYDLYIWIDDDIYITNDQIDIYNLVKEYNFDSLLFSKDVTPNGSLNAGMIVIKNNPNTIKLLNKIYDMVEECGTRFAHNWEQDAFIKYFNSYMINPKEIVIIPHKIIQSFYRNYDLPDNLRWQKKDFAAHITGMPIETRLKILDYIIKTAN
jgi:hypothetical protein